MKVANFRSGNRSSVGQSSGFLNGGFTPDNDGGAGFEPENGGTKTTESPNTHQPGVGLQPQVQPRGRRKVQPNPLPAKRMIAHDLRPPVAVPSPITHLDNLLHVPTPTKFPPCVYFLTRRDKVVYIGKSVRLHNRLMNHLCSKGFDEIFYIPIPAAELDIAECAFIDALKPQYNYTSNGRLVNRCFPRAEIEAAKIKYCCFPLSPAPEVRQ